MDAGREDTFAVLQTLTAVITKLLGGPLPEYPDLAGVRTVLDLGCRYGDWILDVAHLYPDLVLTGLDNESRMIEYARDRAQRLKRPERVRFESFGVAQFPWPLEDHTFELVHGRFLQSFLQTQQWPRVLAECQRVLKPGGRVRLTEVESTITNSSAYAQLLALLAQVLQQDGHSFATGTQSNGITHMLGHLLVQAGFQDIELIPHVIDYSTTEGRYSLTELIMRLFAPSLFGKQFVQRGFLSSETYQQLYLEAQQQVFSDDFCACTYFLTVSGQIG